MPSTLPAFNEVWQRQFRSGWKTAAGLSCRTKFLIGCSGGVDSMLLLHLMFLCPEKIRAIYVDHQLQSGSAERADLFSMNAEADIAIVQPVIVAQGNLENQAPREPAIRPI